MIQFNELRIDSNKHLIVDVEVTTDSTLDPHSIININHLYVGFGTNYTNNCIDFMVDHTIATPEIIYETTYQGEDYPRRVRLDVDLNNPAVQLLYNNKLVYVEAQVDTEGIQPPTCGYKDKIMGYTYDKCLLASKVFNYLKQTDNMCANIDEYANYITQVKGLELAVESGNFGLANNYWNKFFGNNTTNNSLTFNTGCRCRQ